jgi:hypothetical protein
MRVWAKPVFRAHRYFVVLESVAFVVDPGDLITRVSCEYRAGVGDRGEVDVSEQGPISVGYGHGDERRFIVLKGLGIGSDSM